MSWRSNGLVIVLVSVLVLAGVFAVWEVTDWNGGSYVMPLISPFVVPGAFWWFSRTRSLVDVDARTSGLQESQEVVVAGLSESEAMDLAIRAMLQVPGARLVERSPEMSWGRFSGGLRSWGEFCVVTVVGVSPTRLSIRSRPTLNITLLDWGKNRQNVSRVVERMHLLRPDVFVVITPPR